MRIRELDAAVVALIATIDRSEHVDVEYGVVGGALVTRPVSMVEVPAWDPTGTGPHSVAHQLEFCRALVADGAVLLGAYATDEDDAPLLALAIVDPDFEPQLAWFAHLHVSRPHRRKGAARALWNAAAEHARAAGATSMYVSATPSGSAVGFYLDRGCRLADPPHPVLFAHEPDDIHFVCPLR